mgnify:FL=1|jgi:hypothetical protein
MPISRRRLYVNGLSSIIGNSTAENALINWAANKNIDTLMYYGIRGYLGASPATNFAVSNTAADNIGKFLQNARLSNIPNHVAVMGGSKEYITPASAENELNISPFGNKIINNYHAAPSISYNQTKSFFDNSAGRSGLNLELEYWWDHTLGGASPVYPNGVTDAGYQTWLATGDLNKERLKNFSVWAGIIKSYNRWKEWMKNQNRFVSNEAYIGFLNPPGYEMYECGEIVKNLQTINIHAYRAPNNVNDSITTYASNIWNYVRTRVDWVGRAQAVYLPFTKMKISLIYSFEQDSSGNPIFSSPWFQANPGVTLDQLHNAVEAQFNASSFPGKNYVEIVGWTIFPYSTAKIYLP